jgi:hypothetical protein
LNSIKMPIGEGIHAFWKHNLETGESWKKENKKINFMKFHWKNKTVNGTFQSMKIHGGLILFSKSYLNCNLLQNYLILENWQIFLVLPSNLYQSKKLHTSQDFYKLIRYKIWILNRKNKLFFNCMINLNGWKMGFVKIKLPNLVKNN